MASNIQNRRIPYDADAEQAVLGGVFLDNQSLPLALEYVQPKDFYLVANRYIFAAMVDLASRNQAIDTVTVPDYLKAKHQFQTSGGMKYLAQLAESVPTAANVKYYAKIVRDKSTYRNLIQVSNQIKNAAYNQPTDVNKTLDKAENKVLNISREESNQGLKPIGGLLTQSFEQTNKLANNHSEITGLPTGYKGIDKMTTGLHRGEFVVIAARPAMGKTTFAVNVAHNVIMNGGTVAFFSLEMGAGSIIDKVISCDGDITATHLRTGQLRPAEWQNYMISLCKLASRHLYIDDTPGINISSLVARAERLKKEDKSLGLIIVDYLQLVEGNNKSDRQQEVSEVSRQLKKLAKELDIPVIALSQLSRSVEQREDKRPVLSDIRESGSIEQDADIVAFLYRKDYYERSKDDGKTNQSDSDSSDTEFIVEKNRSGPRGTIHLMFIKPYSKFTSIVNEIPKNNDKKLGKTGF